VEFLSWFLSLYARYVAAVFAMGAVVGLVFWAAYMIGRWWNGRYQAGTPQSPRVTGKNQHP
jgi:hypothetical protein